MIEEGTRSEFKHNIFAYMVSTSEWEIEINLLNAFNADGFSGSSLGYEAKSGWLYLTFLFFTAANSKAMVVKRAQKLAPLADCYLDSYDIVEFGTIRYKGWLRFKHVLSPNVKVLQEKVGFNTKPEVKRFLATVGEKAFDGI